MLKKIEVSMQELNNFQYIWEEWIKPLSDDLYQQLDNNFKVYCNVQKRDMDKLRYKAEKYYQSKRTEVKKAFYGEYHKGDSLESHRMDFHKIGAILCRTLIEYKVYSFDIKRCKEYIKNNISPYDTDWSVQNALINFRMAFYTSVVFLYQSMLYSYKNKSINPAEGHKLYQKLLEQGTLDLYVNKFSMETAEKVNETAEKPDMVHESFENCIVLDLAKRDIGNRSFDYFMYAIILYQLEQHNKNILLDSIKDTPIN